MKGEQKEREGSWRFHVYVCVWGGGVLVLVGLCMCAYVCTSMCLCMELCEVV